MPTIKGECGNCGSPVGIRFGQVADHWDPVLGWWESYQCPKCGDAMEADGGEEIPEAYRQLILDEEGVWAARLPPDVQLSVQVLSAARKVCRLSLAEVAELKSTSQGEIASGNHAEMEQVQHGLASLGVAVTVVRIESTG